MDQFYAKQIFWSCGHAMLAMHCYWYLLQLDIFWCQKEASYSCIGLCTAANDIGLCHYVKLTCHLSAKIPHCAFSLCFPPRQENGLWCEIIGNLIIIMARRTTNIIYNRQGPDRQEKNLQSHFVALFPAITCNFQFYLLYVPTSSHIHKMYVIHFLPP